MKRRLVIAATLVCIVATLIVFWNVLRSEQADAGRATARGIGAVDDNGPEERGVPPQAAKSGTTRTRAEGLRDAPGREESEPVHRLAGASADPDSATLRVLVVDEQDHPMPGIEVSVTISRDGVGMSGGACRTDAGGRAEFPGLEPSEFMAASVSVGGLWRSVNARVLGFDLVEGRVVEVRIVVPAGVPIEGDVSHVEKGPVSQATVRLSRRDGSYADYAYGHTDADGHYRIGDVPPGVYEVELSAEGLAVNETKQGTLTVAAPGPVQRNFILGQLSVHGFVVDAVSKEPVAGVTVTVWKPRYASTRTDKHGRYRLTGIPAGKCNMTAGKDGYVTAHVFGGEVVADAPRRQDFALATAAIVQLHVVDTEGKPMPGEFTFRVQGGPGGGFLTTITADGEGRVRYARLGPGSYTFAIERAGWRTATRPVEVAAGENAVRFELERTRQRTIALAGTIVDAETGKPVKGARVWVEWGWHRTYSDAEGRYAFEDVPAGRWQVRVERDNFADESSYVQKEDGKEARADFELQPAATLLLRVLDWEGRAVHAELLIMLTPTEGGRKASANVETDRDGKLSYRRVLPGRYRLRVAWPRKGRGATDILIDPGENFVEVRLKRS